MESSTIRERWDGMSFEDGLTTFIAINIVFFLGLWGTGLAFLYVDLYNQPKWMAKYKTQPGKNVPVNQTDLRRLFKQATINYVGVGIPYSVLHYVLHTLRGNDMTFTLPTIHEFVSCAVAFPLILEITFYYSHRMLHSRYLYKSVHRLHHEWTAPIGLGTVYAHPLEYAFSNILPVAAGPLVMGCCQVTTCAWVFIATMGAVVSHSGYHLPLLPSNEAHDYHHLKFTGNYGFLGILDRLHGTTSAQWFNSKQYKRHRFIFSAADLN